MWKRSGFIVVVALLIGNPAFGQGTDVPSPTQPGRDVTPVRLSFTDGRVSFWRPGAADWVQALVNTPLAPGDELATGAPGTLELQFGPRAFIRAWADTQLGLESQEPDFLQVKVTAGHASLDLRTLESGHTVEIDTPNAAIMLEHPGYYRIDVLADRTSVITRHGGRAAVTPASGATVNMTPSEEVIIEGTAVPQVNAYAAPPLDVWDQWNYARTESFSESVSARYVSPGTYGLEELDQYGTWRTVPTYGQVWIPTSVPPDWVPYSTGSWVSDPYYGWTWVSSLPWGWAPFHYGRWIFLNGYWAWTPGPIIARPVYAPALVAFLGTPAAGVSVSAGGPLVGWVALGWGEPCVPWWGSVGFVHRPWWGGWGGPRVVNKIVINRTTVVNVENIHVYQNVSAHNAVVAVNPEHFGHGPITGNRAIRFDVGKLQPLHAGPPVQVSAASFVPTTARSAKPSEDVLRRSVVATRQPRLWSEAAPERRVQSASVPTTPAPRIVTLTRPQDSSTELSRPTLGQSPIERPMSDRVTPPAPPRRDRAVRPEGSPRGSSKPATLPSAQQVPQPAPQTSRPESPPVPTGRPATAPSVPVPPQSARPAAPVRPESSAPVAHGTGAPAPGSRPTPPAVSQPAQPVPTRETGKRAALQTTTPAPEASAGRAKSLPGEPANRLAPQRAGNFSSSRPTRSGAPTSVQRPHEPAGASQKESGNDKQPTK